MTFGLSRVTLAVIAIVAGILILILPELLRWIVGIFLVVWGIIILAGRRP